MTTLTEYQPGALKNMDGKYIIEWEFLPKHKGKGKRYWTGFGSGYSTDKDSAIRFPTLKLAEVESHKIMDSRKIGASPRYDS